MAALLKLWAAALGLASACGAECELKDVDDADSLSLLQQHARVLARGEGGRKTGRAGDQAAPCNPNGPVQVFSDVDDTFMSSGGKWPAGCDGVYEKSVIYPGYAQFVLELARGQNESLAVLRPALFSARPETFDFLKVDASSPMAAALSAEPHQDKHPVGWDQLNAEIPIDVPHGLMSYNYQQGGIEQLVKGQTGLPFGLNIEGSKYGHWNDFTDTHKMGETKYENFQEFYLEEAAAESAKACVIFIGDDGQGDCNPAAQEMRKYVKHDPHELGLKAAFIHRLTCNSKNSCPASAASPGQALVVMFDDYLDAARQAADHGLVSIAGVARVREAVAVFFAIYCNEDGTGRLTETLGDLGCSKLKESLSKDHEGAPSAAALEQLRPMQRLQAWCTSCCNGQISNHRTTYDFQKKKLRCHHMYQETSWWHIWSTGAQDNDCKSHCGHS